MASWGEDTPRTWYVSLTHRHDEARAYYRLCDAAEARGIDTRATDATALDSQSVAKLRAAVGRS